MSDVELSVAKPEPEAAPEKEVIETTQAEEAHESEEEKDSTEDASNIRDAVKSDFVETIKDTVKELKEKVEDGKDVISERVKQADEIAKKLPPKLRTVATESMEKLRERVGEMAVTPGNIITILRYAMEIIETTQVKGKEQRDLAIYLVKQFIRDAPISDALESKCLAVVEDDVLSVVIDTIIAATQGKLSVNLVRKNLLTVLKAKCACLHKLISKVWKK